MNRTTNVVNGESDAIRRELNAHNEAQRVRYRARAASMTAMCASQQGRSHLTAVGAA
jgi:hypothetical protein